MNYRHDFHAGNFADLVKHAALLSLLKVMTRVDAPLAAFDTHAGAGLYDLEGEAARRSGEAAAGVEVLMAARGELPPELEALRAAVAAANPGGGTRFYPGSPWLIARALRPGDRYLACELRPEEHARLSRALAGCAGAASLCADGYKATREQAPKRGATLVLVDPPYERPDDYRRAAETVAAIRTRNRQAAAMIWAPLKDLETFDGFLRELTAATGEAALALEARMRPLTDPMAMNGCALVFVGAPAGLERPLAVIGDWVTGVLGKGGQARIFAAS